MYVVDFTLVVYNINTQMKLLVITDFISDEISQLCYYDFYT